MTEENIDTCSELSILNGFLSFKISKEHANQIRKNHPELLINPNHIKIVDSEKKVGEGTK